MAEPTKLRAVGTLPVAQEDSDADLLLCMSWAEQDSKGAKDAWEEFYRRHVEYVFFVCRKVAVSTGSRLDVEEAVQEVFIRAYTGSGTFKEAKSDDRDKARRRVRAWLGAIAKNVFQDMARGRYREGPVEEVPLDEVAEDTLGAASAPREYFESSLVKKVAEILRDGLTAEERYVILVTMLWHDPTRETEPRLPNDVSEELANQLETTPENVRKLRWRAMKKITAAIGELEPIPKKVG